MLRPLAVVLVVVLARPALAQVRAGGREQPQGAPPAAPAPVSPTTDEPRGDAITTALQALDWPRAEALLLEAIEAHPGSPDLLRTLGGVFFMENRPLNAAVAFKKAEALAPLDDRSRFTLAMAYVALGRRDWARPELETLVKADAGNPLYPYWIARLDYDDGQYEPAVASLGRSLALDPGFVKAHDNLGLCYEALGRFDEALHSYEEAVRLNREDASPSPWPPLNMGLLLLRLNRVEEAEARLRESATVDPRFARARYHLGLALEKLERFGEAVPELEEAARLDPAYPEPQYALARVYRRAGEREKSARALRRFQELRKKEGHQEQGGMAPEASQ
jgi:tetratricopeptide (TPR) repeat protein